MNNPLQSFKKRMLMMGILLFVLLQVAITANIPLIAIGQAYADAGNTTVSPKNQQMNVTFYGFADNNPPSGIISDGHVHQTAGGTGTYDDPMTAASNAGKPGNSGTRFYVAAIKKYVMYEDHEGTNAQEQHLDIWIASDASSGDAVVQCENNQPANGMQTVIMDPDKNQPVDTTPMFDVKTKQCNLDTGKTATAGGTSSTSSSSSSSSSTAVVPSAVCAGSTNNVCPSAASSSSSSSSSSTSPSIAAPSAVPSGTTSSGGCTSNTPTLEMCGNSTGLSGLSGGFGGGGLGNIGGMSSIFVVLLILLMSIL